MRQSWFFCRSLLWCCILDNFNRRLFDYWLILCLFCLSWLLGLNLSQLRCSCRLRVNCFAGRCTFFATRCIRLLLGFRCRCVRLLLAFRCRCSASRFPFWCFGFGIFVSGRCISRLTRIRFWSGLAWFSCRLFLSLPI